MTEKKKFFTIFPKYRDFHFFKDPGQLPFRFLKNGFDAAIICYQNEKDYPATNKHIPMKCITKNYLTRKFNLGLIIYLLRMGRRIDILNMFHFTWQTLLLGYVYKMINHGGFLYIKMDNCHDSGNYPWETIFDPTIIVEDHFKHKDTFKLRLKHYLIKKMFVDKVDLWSVEDEESQKYYENKYPFFKNKLVTSYNGHAVDLIDRPPVKEFEEKENIILTAGRLGTHQKATEVLLEAFRIVAARLSWSLYLAGGIEPSFEKIILKFFTNNPELTGRVHFCGLVGKKELFELYNRSKIFCLASRFEGFAVVYPEAMYFGNAIITTPYSSLKEMIIKKKFGAIVEKDAPEALAECVLDLIGDEYKLREYADNARQLSATEFNWNEIVLKLKSNIEERNCHS
ncbi:MAG: glycosyltransferase family 4 protein [Candidatus Aminicenantes bacterium]|nr:glycosyltransferase family 4 protein [Planctomycetota bacterium]MCG2810725.1 glycosyltransferase family 4 protein [Candidatus Aminicenantes bacterium]